MFEFYRPLDTCGHFEHMIIKGESNEAEIGVKQDAGTPRTTASISANLPEGSFKRHTDHAFKWSGQIATNAGSHSECESRCKSSSDCQGYTFFDQRKLCRLMDVQAELVEDGTAVSGAKQ